MDLFNIVTLPLKKIANLLFSLVIELPEGSSNIASLIIVGVLFIVLIGAIMHSHGVGIGRLFGRLRRNKGE